MKWLRIVLITIGVFLLQLLINHVNLLNELDSTIPGIFYRLRGELKPDSNIAIVAIDQVSVNEIGAWNPSWRRNKIAELVDSISACRPAVIYINLLFRKTANSSDATPEKERDTRVLAEAFRRAGNVIIPYNFRLSEDNSVSLLATPPPFIADSKIRTVIENADASEIKEAGKLQSPEPSLAEAALATGFNNIAKDSASKSNTFAIQAVRYGNDFFPSVSLQVAREYLRLKPDALVLNPSKSVSFRARPALPMNSSGASMVNFYGPSATFKNYPAVDLLSKNFNKDLLTGKIVILGITNLRDAEVMRTPYSEAMPVTEIWANIIQNTLDSKHTFIDFSSSYLTVILLFIFIGLSLLTTFCLSRSLAKTVPLLAVAGLILLFLSYVLFLAGAWLSFYISLLYLVGFFAFKLFRRLMSGPQAATGAPKDDLSTTTQFSADGQLLRIHRYKILKEIGCGAMGTVYKAVDPTINRVVAIKTVRFGSGQQGGEMHERFHREAQAAGGLSHPNIVTIYDFGDIPPMSYIAMEFLEGETLEQKLASPEKPSVDQIIRIIAQVAEGLSLAHEKAIIHRDIKPGNIMLLAGGALAKIMDFGVARMTDATMTETGKTLGTPHYMSPEQIKGEIVDARSDIFSLAAMAYEALAGRRPFTGDNLSALSFAIVNNAVPEISLYTPETNTALNAVFRKALAKERDDRFATAVEFARAFSMAFGKKA